MWLYVLRVYPLPALGVKSYMMKLIIVIVFLDVLLRGVLGSIPGHDAQIIISLFLWLRFLSYTYSYTYFQYPLRYARRWGRYFPLHLIPPASNTKGKSQAPQAFGHINTLAPYWNPLIVGTLKSQMIMFSWSNGLRPLVIVFFVSMSVFFVNV